MQIYEKKLRIVTYFLFLTVILILVFNVFSYHPILGYDGEAHDGYIDHLSRYLPDSINLPLKENTREFFNPPIAYLFPSLIQVICRNTIKAQDFLLECKPFYNKASQVFQSFLYLFTLLINMKTIKIFTKSKYLLNISYLLPVSILAVNYRTISMIRGEVYILFFLSLLLNRLLNLKLNHFRYKSLDVLIFGFIIGLLALSRQWAFLLFPALFILAVIVEKQFRNQYIKFITGTFIIGFFVSSWFYFNLYFEYGSFTSFNVESSGFSLSNQPLSFYLPLDEELTYLFTKPIRPYYGNNFLPILYSDLWGDYWGYFLFTSRFLDIGRNQLVIGDYLARVNIVSFVPSFLILFGFYKITKKYKKDIFIRYISLSIMFSFFGYLWFLISYPSLPNGDTIKATYMVQIFNLSVFLFALWINQYKEINYKKYFAVIGVMVVVFIHNFSSYLSHFPIDFILNL
jgi:hypothetical protein